MRAKCAGILSCLLLFAISCSSDDSSQAAKGPSCNDGLSLCASDCVDLHSDPAHCGLCENSCGPAEACVDGRCLADTCDGGRLRCGSACVDPESDAAHCGACDSPCPEGESCVDGACAPSCPGGLRRCGESCVDLSSDTANCGFCDNKCSGELVCSQGECSGSCEGGRANCGGACKDTRSDPAHCGSCGNACDAGVACEGGLCACPEGLSRCDGVCVDTQRDELHCGSCGKECDAPPQASAICEQGTCAYECDAGFGDCDGKSANGCETDTSLDDIHCSACNQACAPGTFCSSSACISYCAPGMTWCDPKCTDTDFDQANCGACDAPCGPDRHCLNGDCFCKQGLVSCGETCTDTDEDREHCGGCNKPCSPGAVCSAGECMEPCADGLAACNRTCVDTATDDKNCGACGRGCGSLPGVASGTCSGGTCSLVCEDGFEDCDGDPTNGCESDVQSDRNHCGACNQACTTNCQGGACQQTFIGANLGGWGHTCLVDRNADLRCFGRNHLGQLGTGSQDGATGSNSVPLLIASGMSQVALGEGHGCALSVSGTVSCWGYNNLGRVGSGVADVPGQPGNNLSPTQVPGIADAIQVAVGINHSCALLQGGTVKCWGDNAKGQLGDGSTGNHQTAPVTVKAAPGVDLRQVLRIGAGQAHTCALLQGGAVHCWGANDKGQLGRGGLAPTEDPQPAAVSGLATALDLSVGRNHSCALTQGGEARCWGHNQYGQIGDGSISQTDPKLAPAKVSLQEVVAVSAGGEHSCAIVQDGTGWCWGRNQGSPTGSGGQLGNGSTADSTLPVKVQNLQGLSQISAGGIHSCAVSGQQFYCWGTNNYGQLGDGTTARRTSPVQVQGVP